MKRQDGPRKRVYFDWAAAAVPDPPPGIVPFGNPSSKHAEGRRAREALENARSRCASVLGVPADRLYFTSGGTESNALVLHSLLLRTGFAARKARFLVSSIEHPSVRENASVLERLGVPGGVIDPEKDGRVTARTLERALEKHPDTRFVSIMAVNNETGAVMDMANLTALLRARKGPPVHIHSDLVQAVGKIPADLGGWDLDSASISAHKIGGPRGVGLLYLRRPLEVLYTGGGQEGGLRPGTENTAGALGLADCLERRAGPETVPEEYRRASLRWKGLIRALRGMERCVLIPRDRGEEDPAFSPWILQAAFRDIPGEVMVRALDDLGFAVSAGSACSSASAERPVLAAMGVDEATAREGIRISQGWITTGGDIEDLTAAIRKLLRVL
jgi:cysteine desulfurase